MRRTHLSLAAALALLLVGVVTAQETPAESGKAPDAKKKADKPAGPELDEGAKKIWDSWKAVAYNLGREGVKRSSCRIRASYADPGRKLEGTAAFAWDGEKGSLDWDNPQLGSLLGSQGWGLGSLTAAYRPDAMDEGLAGCRITLKAGETEDRLDVSAPPSGRATAKAFVFDKAGVLRKWIMDVPGPGGQPFELALEMKWQKLDNGKYVSSGWSFGAPGYSETTTITLEKRGKWHVISKVDAAGTMGGQPMVTKKLEFTDWKFNDDVEAAAAEKPAKKEKPTSVPDKPTGG